VLLGRQLDLFGRELLAVDGTRIKAVNNKDRNFTRASLTEFIKLADAKLGDDPQRLDQTDATESGAASSQVKNLSEKIAAIRGQRDRSEVMLAELDRTEESQISLTDPDSRAMAAHVAVGYNAQIAVDTKHKLIVEQQVTNQALGNAQKVGAIDCWPITPKHSAIISMTGWPPPTKMQATSPAEHSRHALAACQVRSPARSECQPQ
jgi:hypothetical protein